MRPGDILAYLRYPVCSPYRLVWSLFRDNTSPAAYINYAFAQHVWRKRTPYNYVMLALLMVGWPVIFLGAWLHFMRRCGFKVKRLTGKGIWRQTAEQLVLAATQSIAPSKYYIFELFGDARRARADEHIIRYMFKGGVHTLVNDWMQATSANTGKRVLNNKLNFDLHGKEHGFATIGSVCGIKRGGETIWVDHPGPDLPSIDLFIKPTKGKGGRGCERWDCVGPGRFRRFGDGETKSAAELLEHVHRLARRKAQLVQPRGVNHADLSDLGGAALSSLRVMSIRNDRGEVEVLFAVFKISSRGASVVDNFHAGGFVAGVDIATGELGEASDWGIKQPGRWLAVHPVTGAQIAGRRLPHWQETIDLVRRAHETIERIVVGWDVAITDRGPAIIEGNGQFGLDMVQRTHRIPVGNSRFCELYAWHVSQALHHFWGLPVRPRPASGVVATLPKPYLATSNASPVGLV